MRIVLPLQAGSAGDASVRVLSDALSKALGQTVIIDNQPGAGGITGTAQIARAAPDGNTIGVVSTNYAVNPALYPNLPFDSLNDITPITMIGGTPILVVAHPSLGVKNLAELVAVAKEKPGTINYGSSGNGTILHLAIELLANRTGIKLQHVPYRGAGQFLQDLVAGQIQLGAYGENVVASYVNSGALRAIGATTPQRTPLSPDVPTIAEQGVPGYAIEGWFAAIGPKNLPEKEVARLNAGFATALADPKTRDTLIAQGNSLNPGTPDAARKVIADAVALYADLVRQTGVKLE